MSDAPDRVRRQCMAAGMDPQEPLAVLLVGLAEDREQFRRTAEHAAEIVAKGTISPQAEAQLLRAIPREVAGAVRGAIAETVTRAGVATLAATAALTLLAGTVVFFVGRWSAPDAIPLVHMLEGAGFMTQVASLNNDVTLRDFCLSHVTARDADGGAVCSLPPVRITATMAKQQAAAGGAPHK